LGKAARQEIVLASFLGTRPVGVSFTAKVSGSLTIAGGYGEAYRLRSRKSKTVGHKGLGNLQLFISLQLEKQQQLSS